jgi:hypothetical protein
MRIELNTRRQEGRRTTPATTMRRCLHTHSLTDRPAPPQEEHLRLPWDLSEWVDKPTLRAWIEAELDTLDWQSPALTAYLKAHPHFRPRALLALLTFAYATGWFESEEIFVGCLRDATLRSLCAEPPPTSLGLARFRRENRRLLEWALARLLTRAVRARFNLGEALLPAGLRRYLAQAATERLDAARHLDRGAHGA